jgi:diguanylate cyclase (GGDEF)-like protein
MAMFAEMAVDRPEPEDRPPGPGEGGPLGGSANGSRLRRAERTGAERDDEQSLAEDDQTASETDQTLSDADHSASASDQTSAERDQAASDSDQAASDHDLASGVNQAAHDFSRSIRQRSTREREQTAQERLRIAEQRDAAAHLRDLAALARDHAADARDVAMAQLEAVANEQERTRALTGVELVARAGEQRKRAALHRAQAASYRLLAAEDRHAAARDRQQAAQERQRARSDREALAIELERAAVDTLTGARTRAAGLRELEHELVRARRTGSPLVVVYIDVVGLKAINDLRGHAAGDAALKHVVAQVKAYVRPYDLIIRLGGDEFLCVMSNLTEEAARDRFDEIAAALDPASSPGAIRTGFAQLREHEAAERLIARADSELLRHSP